MKNWQCINFIFILLIFSFVSSAQETQLKWTESAPGIWKAIAGKPEVYDLLKASGALPNNEALLKLGALNFPISQNEIVGNISDGKTYLRFPLDKDEQL